MVGIGIDITSCDLAEPMRRALPLLMVMLVCLTPVVQAGAPVDTGAGALFSGSGGSVVEANTTTAMVADLGPVFEDYTATWCTNCVEVEDALEDLVAEQGGHIFAFHRSIGEPEDPFGTDALDERWEDRYESRQAPTVVFNGTTLVRGSVPTGASLLEDFRPLANTSLDLPSNGTSTLSWTAAENNRTNVTWALNLPESSIWNGHLVRLEAWVVETTATFPEGSNGQGTYPHIVRSITLLEEQVWEGAIAMGGTHELDLPTAFDGTDLEVHLVHNLVPRMIDTAPPNETAQPVSIAPEDDSALPASSGGVTLLTLALASRRGTRRPQGPVQAE